LRKKHGKTSVRVVEKCPDIPVAIVQYTFTQTMQRTTQMGQNTQNGTYESLRIILRIDYHFRSNFKKK
jgi:hypothetical protein